MRDLVINYTCHFWILYWTPIVLMEAFPVLWILQSSNLEWQSLRESWRLHLSITFLTNEEIEEM